MRLRTGLASMFAALYLLTGCQTLGGGGVEQADRAFASDEEFRIWFAFYYKDPHPEFVTAALKFMHEQHYLEDYPDIASVFLSRVFIANPTALGTWVGGWTSLDPKEWDVVLLALWLTNTNEARTLVTSHLDRADGEHRGKLKEMLTRDPKQVDPLVAEVVDPRQINLIWAAFSATGDQRYVQKVISYVHFYGEEGDQTQSDIGEAAIMTLANNALQHETVATVCEAQDKDNPDPRTRILLKAMLNALAQMAKEGPKAALPTH